jgi:hypothetical protein
MDDKLLLIISKTAVASRWIEQEVEIALAKEGEQKRTVLFPIRIEDVVMNILIGWPALIRNARHIGDFRYAGDLQSEKHWVPAILMDLGGQAGVRKQRSLQV